MKYYIRAIAGPHKGEYWLARGAGYTPNIEEAYAYPEDTPCVISILAGGSNNELIEADGVNAPNHPASTVKPAPLVGGTIANKNKVNADLKIKWVIDVDHCDRFLKAGGYRMETRLLPEYDEHGIAQRLINMQCLVYIKDGLEQYFTAREALTHGYIEHPPKPEVINTVDYRLPNGSINPDFIPFWGGYHECSNI